MANEVARKITKQVLERMSSPKNRRLKQLVQSLIKHLHGFVTENELTEAEWWAAIQFLTRTGHMCKDGRQEFILLSDTLGVSMLVDAINHHAKQGATESTVLGPFYLEGTKFLPHGAKIYEGKGGDPTVVSGRVLSTTGKPIKGAVLEVWQTGPHALYDVQDPNGPETNCRARFRTDAQGRFWFRTVKPVSYPVPHDGPVGQFLSHMGRHPFRPAHIHFKISANGYVPVTTHLFVKGNRHLKSDVVFGVKQSLIADFKRRTSPEEAKRLKVPTPYFALEYDFKLMPLAAGQRISKAPRVVAEGHARNARGAARAMPEAAD